MNPHPNPPPPPYFKLKPPGHFYIRTDLLEELCYSEALEASLPTNKNSHAQWLNRLDLKAEEYPLEKIREDNNHPLPPGDFDRYILHAPVLPRNRHRSYLVTNRLGYSAECEGAGLYEFVMLRAVAYAAWRGFSREKAWHALHATSPKERDASSPRISPKWSVGFDRSTGLCTILAHAKPDTPALYLAGNPNYFVPIFSA